MKGSSLPKHYTISVPVNHRELIDRGLTRDNGEDLQIYYHANVQHPVQIDRVLSGLGTKSATVQFRLQARISANTVDDSSYSLVLGSAVSGSVMDNPDLVYAFHDDFSSSAMKKEWATNNYGFIWKDVEVELDLMETGTKQSCTGPFLRVSNVDHSKTTGWWFEYYLAHRNSCTTRPQFNNKDGGWKYNSKLPTAFTLNTWFHFRYQVIGDRFSQWANNKLVHDNVQDSAVMCLLTIVKTLYDNIKVRFIVTSPPKITLGVFLPGHLSQPLSQSNLLGEKKLPAASCKQIHDASLVNSKTSGSRQEWHLLDQD
ncbi:hypothetical protein OS493_030826 [Desmophyllum pertusum]|uniref:Uncharacterized protein n=1 Tax=Desmophyllum pertusum TaxID=174260 RepID=A0A9W9YJR6_9CNID|nr:hypothetical protein OS493_030826 [Desmophyllum pertusum]